MQRNWREEPFPKEAKLDTDKKFIDIVKKYSRQFI